jgi:hypothetical protein
MSGHLNLKDNALPYPNVLDFTHWGMDTLTTEDKYLDSRRTGEWKKMPETNLYIRSLIIIQMFLPNSSIKLFLVWTHNPNVWARTAKVEKG